MEQVLETVRRHLPANAGCLVAIAVCTGLTAELLYRHTGRIEGPLSLIFLVLVALLLYRRRSKPEERIDKVRFQRLPSDMPREPQVLKGLAAGGRMAESDLPSPVFPIAPAPAGGLAATAVTCTESHPVARQGAASHNFRNDSGRPAPVTVSFDLEGMAASVGALFSARAEEKGLELVLDSGFGLIPALKGDPYRLGRILNTLIGNAITFSSRGDVVVAVREVARDGDQIELQFSVQDQGDGLTPGQQAQLFRAVAESGVFPSGRQGSNGLAICKHLVENLGGSIWVESQYGAGSTFHFRVRLRRDQSLPGFSYGGRLRPLAGQHVLVIDDNAASRRVIGALLVELGFIPDLFPSGRAALARLAGDSPPAYLFCCTDLSMPDLDGIEMARQLRAHYGRACPPLLLMTAFGHAPNGSHPGSDFTGVIKKPVTLGGLFASVAAVLGMPDTDPVPRPCVLDRPARLQGKRILLVEHGDLHGGILAAILREADVQVRLAASGLEALQAVREEMPDCVLMDCRMPAMDGYEVAARLRFLGYAKLPLIALGTEDQGSDREICLAAGINDFLARPIVPSSLFAILGKWIASPEPCSRPTAIAPAWPPATSLPTAADGGLPPLPPGIDAESGLRHLHGRTALFLKALRIFRDSRGHRFQLEFRAAVTAEDWLTSERLARGLKGTAATIGANEVSAAAAILENAVRAGNYGAVQALSADLIDRLRALVDGLSHIG